MIMTRTTMSSVAALLSLAAMAGRIMTVSALSTTSGLKSSMNGVFPMSTRHALAEKARKVQEAAMKGGREADASAAAAADDAFDNRYQYTIAGWSNRAAMVLTPVHIRDDDGRAGGVYTADRPFYWNNIDVSCRMTVIELPSGGVDDRPDLWVHSPVGLDGPLMKALDSLGTVKYVVSPNYEHVKYVPQWYQTYPDAQYWGCPGLMEKMPDIPFRGEIPVGCRPVGYAGGNTGDLPWDAEDLQPFHVDMESVPLIKKSFFNEVIYYHRPTKTLMMTDLYWNYPQSVVPNSQYDRDDTWELAPLVDEIPPGSKFWKLAMDRVYYPFYNNFMIADRDKFRDMARHILYGWDVETVIPAHGDILRGRDFIRGVLTKHFRL